MKKQIVDINKAKGIAQITTLDERVYSFPTKDKVTGLPTYVFKPSSTYILSVGYPKGKFFIEWLKKNGDDSEEIKTSAGVRGSKIHQAVESILTNKTNEVRMDDVFKNTETGRDEELEPDEYEAVISFVNWYEEQALGSTIEVIGIEFNVDSDTYDYAGTIDLFLKTDGEYWIIDIKTGKNIYEEHKMQVSSYKQCIVEKPVVGEHKIKGDIKMGILQLGYTRNKNRYKFTEIEDKFELFLHAKQIFHNEVKKLPYRQIGLPIVIKLNLKDEKKTVKKRK